MASITGRVHEVSSLPPLPPLVGCRSKLPRRRVLKATQHPRMTEQEPDPAWVGGQGALGVGGSNWQGWTGYH